jgi:signal transduction histidine kinase
MKALLLSLFLISTIPLFAQSSEADSLNSMISNCQPFDGDICRKIVQNAIESVKGNSDEQLYPRVLIISGKAYLDNGLFEEGKQLLLVAKRISDSLGVATLRGDANKLLGIIARNQGDFEQSLAYHLSAAKIWEESGNKIQLARSYLGISSVFFDTDRLAKSQYYDNLVMGIAEELDNDELRFNAISNIAVNSMMTGINYYQQNIEDSSMAQQARDTLDYYFRKSEVEFYEGLALARKMGSQEDELSLLNNLVALTMNMENNEKALKLAKASEILAEANGDISLIIHSKINIGSAYRRLENLDMAAKYGEESLALAKKHGLARKEYVANRSLYDLYKLMGNYRQANVNLEAMRDYDNKVGNMELNEAMAKLELEYQNEKSEKQILLQKNSILELTAENMRNKRQQAYMAGGSIFLLLLVFFFFQLNRVKKDRNDKVAFAEALINTQEEERIRIGRDLHDGIGQSLLLIKKQVLIPDKTTDEIGHLITHTLEEVRAISRDLHPFHLKQFGLNAAITDMLSKVEKSSGLFVSKALPDMDELISRKSEIHVYRTIQEALNNVVKHAQATALKLSAELSESMLLISIQDNGIGFEKDVKSPVSRSLGLRTMSERMASIGGKVSIASSHSSGTTITLRVPRN